MICFIIEELTKRGYQVGSRKHSSHVHAIDKAGSDSDCHRLAGAKPAVFQTPAGIGVFWDIGNEDHTEKHLESVFSHCDIVIIESFRNAEGPKILLTDQASEADNIENVIAIISDMDFKTSLPKFQPNSPELINFIENSLLNI